MPSQSNSFGHHMVASMGNFTTTSTLVYTQIDKPTSSQAKTVMSQVDFNIQNIHQIDRFFRNQPTKHSF